MPRYVILAHDHPFLHWDLMLETSGVLRTWRLAKPPEPGTDIAAKALGDHRIAYLDFEGPVSGNRGSVRRWDAGTFEWMTDAHELVRVRMSGQRLKGELSVESAGGDLVCRYRAGD